MTVIMEGKTLAKKIIKNIENEIIKRKLNLSLTIVMIGSDPASKIYVAHKLKVCKQIGINGKLINMPENSSLLAVKNNIKKLNQDINNTGFLIQLPLPKHLQKHQKEILNLINYQKDVDGLSGTNINLRSKNEGGIIPATPLGIIELFNYYNFSFKDKYVAVIGQGIVVGKPMAVELTNMSVKHICLDKNSGTAIIDEALQQADVIISSTGVKHLLNKKSQVKKDVILIDVGISSERKNKKIYGDIDETVFFGYAKGITPVPGGVGPMTVASLMQNLLALRLIK